MQFSEYVSLGRDCEAGFQFRRVLGKDYSSFFSWNVTPLPALLSLLESRFQGVLEAQNLRRSTYSTLIIDASHGHQFHSAFEIDGDLQFTPNFAARLEEHRSKAKYLIDKFLRPREPGDAVAYFYKYDDEDDAAYVREMSQKIERELNAIHAEIPFALIVLQHRKRKEPQWNHPNIFNRYLDRLSTPKDATDGHVRSWDEVFREFPHVQPMRLAGFS